ncbi:hypothetical protein ACIQOW_11235 [Kitasatospora sp. NPDC091335]|uniref:hypothetical protein n=1 Tax=Kitasatospora sp. NPDC091335 TaxID=3364085 RepID=UPI003826A8BC
MRRTVITAGAALLAAALLLGSYLDGWWSESGPAGTTVATATRPQVEVPLPTEAGSATTPYPPSAVTLAVGQQLGVRTTGGARPKSWHLDSAGDAACCGPARTSSSAPAPRTRPRQAAAPSST